MSRSIGEGIRRECLRLGIDPEALEPIASNGEIGDALITVYSLGGNLVADTNGDPVWEQSEEWAALPADLREQAERNRSNE